MSDPCFSRQELDDLLQADPRDPRFQHIQQCPRCRSGLAMLRSFLDGDPELADPEREQLLATRMHQVIYEGNATSPNSGSGRWNLFSPLSRGMMALAAVLLVFVTVSRFEWPQEDSTIRLRGSEPSGTEFLAPTVTQDGDSGDLLLSWSSLFAARKYQVTILGSDLGVLEQGIYSKTPTVLIKAESLDRWRSGSPSLLWVVTAWGDDGVLAESAPLALVIGSRSGD